MNQKASSPEVTAVFFKTTSQKEFHPRLAVGLFSRVCSTGTPGRISPCHQEKVCQSLENKTTSSQYYRCRLEKNRCDRMNHKFTPNADWANLNGCFLTGTDQIFLTYSNSSESFQGSDLLTSTRIFSPGEKSCPACRLISATKRKSSRMTR